MATASFSTSTTQLLITSEVVIQQYNQAPLDFFVADYAVEYPFEYAPEDQAVLSAYVAEGGSPTIDLLEDWLKGLWMPGERIETYALLQRISIHIRDALVYRVREEPGVQTPNETLSCGSGSCRDFAALFIA